MLEELLLFGHMMTEIRSSSEYIIQSIIRLVKIEFFFFARNIPMHSVIQGTVQVIFTIEIH